MRNEVLQIVNEEKNTLNEIKRRKINRIDHTLPKNGLLKQVLTERCRAE